jgi:hypothetical protein
LGGGDAILVESDRDRGQAVAGFSLVLDPLDRVRGHGRGPAELPRGSQRPKVNLGWHSDFQVSLLGRQLLEWPALSDGAVLSARSKAGLWPARWWVIAFVVAELCATATLQPAASATKTRSRGRSLLMIASAGCGRGDRNAARALPRADGRTRTGAVATPGIHSSEGGSGSARVGHRSGSSFPVPRPAPCRFSALLRQRGPVTRRRQKSWEDGAGERLSVPR